MVRQARSAQNMTQQQLADKCGLSKYYITKAENNIGEVPVSILRTIINKGLDGHLHIAFKF
ncbi:XRE family transcriptional regulator [Mucilaginibacter limnophilus]|uniref:XRE family transcriptional regulator n=1 Tax=Mucilaginibacter limnophilus TaxID=1932778 RepID=A0A437MXV3_9SPHI|nr:helix-turn-helix transcriptional regulator [Mucilaginibacter limnophilus]RVU02504.1 XRE family transcriptional regulator [Mucilaginibacter limnophilus]